MCHAFEVAVDLSSCAIWNRVAIAWPARALARRINLVHLRVHPLLVVAWSTGFACASPAFLDGAEIEPAKLERSVTTRSASMWQSRQRSCRQQTGRSLAGCSAPDRSLLPPPLRSLWSPVRRFSPQYRDAVRWSRSRHARGTCWTGQRQCGGVVLTFRSEGSSADEQHERESNERSKFENLIWRSCEDPAGRRRRHLDVKLKLHDAQTF